MQKIFFGYIYVVLPDGEPIRPHSKDAAISSMCDFPGKYIKFPKWSCVLNCCIECPGVFIPNAKINGYKYLNLPFIIFHHYKNIISCYSHK